MKVGFSKQNITPPLGTLMMGVGDRDQAHGCTAIHDEIFVRAAYFEHDGDAALVMSFDLCFLGREDADRLKGVLGRELDLLPRQILLSATHSHVSPSVGKWYVAAYRQPDTLYLQALEAAVLQAARSAAQAAQEASLWVCSGKSSLPMNRRRVSNGITKNAPNPEGFVNDSLVVCLIRDVANKPLALLYSIATHPSIVRGFEISAEFPGVACDRLDEYLGTPGSLFLQGTAGDSKPSTIALPDGTWKWDAGWEEMTTTGEILADEVIELIEAGLTQVEPQIATALIETDWPLQPPWARDQYKSAAESKDGDKVQAQWAARQLQQLDKYGALPDTAPVLIQGMQLGKNLRLIAIEGEPVSHYGKMIQEFYPEGTTFQLGYANGEAMYLVTTPMLAEGGMEPESFWEYGHPAPLKPGMESVVEKALKVLHERGVN